MSTQKEFQEIVEKKIKRKGIDNLMEYLNSETDFFSAPASTKYHGSHEGGLLLHSMSVYDSMMLLREGIGIDEGITEESIAICGLFHDVCKANFYFPDDDPASTAQVNYMLDLCEKSEISPVPKDKRTKRYVSEVISALKAGRDLPKFKPTYTVQDSLPIGHGEKSVYLIQKHLYLMDKEALAIRWHLGGFDPGVHFPYPSGQAYMQACRDNRLVGLLLSADFAATYLIDEW
jgi:hypothetical protein